MDDAFIHGIQVKEMQFVAGILPISRHINIIHRRSQGKVLKRHLKMAVRPGKPALFCDPWIFLLPLLMICKFLKEKAVMIVYPHAVSGKPQRCDRIQETGGQPSKSTVSKGRLCFYFFHLGQIESVFCQHIFCFIKKAQILAKAISVPKILVQTSSTVSFKPFPVKRLIEDFEVAAAKIERFDAVNQQLLASVDAQILEVDDAVNTLACMLLDSISELSYDDADFIMELVYGYLAQIDSSEEEKRKIVRRYAASIVDDIRKQVYEHMERKTWETHIVQKDFILFRKFIRNVKENGRVKFDKPFTDKANIKKYLFTGYKKSYYPENAFDSDSERLFSIILEEDSDVIRWIKPPLNQLGLFWQAGQQYNPDFLVETVTEKYMVEVKASKDADSDEVIAKAKEGIKWCRFASTADPDKKHWSYRLITDDNIHPGNSCKYTLGTARKISED